MNRTFDLSNIDTIIKKSQSSPLFNVKQQNELFVIRYIKDVLNFENYEKLYLFRSVITDGKKILSVAPPKSENLNNFMNHCPFDECFLEEFIEGTMINCFYYNNEWVIATRSKIGAMCSFGHKKTFSEMFHEAMYTQNLHFSDLNSNYIYSFVLQYPDNQIVIDYKIPNIVLVEVMQAHNKSVTILNIHSKEFDMLRDKITFPKILENFNSWSHVQNEFTNPNLHYTIMGVVIKEKKTGKKEEKKEN